MTELKIVAIEFTLTEAKIIHKSLASCIPSKDDEMIVTMLYNRISRKIEELTGKHEQL